ncbi:hypothetical protein ACN2MM_06315 [Alkalilimnicola ehrlichii MLHE-1]|uniref:Uncharacterized protein n=1 Tax=Alkalilimnicola ehrlichii (strain ATCC BAA-1101 / DSM 17681 / MLHE-1) TaxID=187272 RepID=Q0A9K5_ALKEH|nr:hypothetical protein [Alkalilimnicola ehrlichii]ABI56482.1 conserved hypothetical protein [Alkalilimnicola ehrlichii MLHE-1]
MDEIDFSRIHTMFRSLVLFDDMFLNMQGMNIAINDSFITDQEYNLLRTYFEIERTPTQQALFVSAQSQMWIFALYELLRTWRHRIRKLKTWRENGAIPHMMRRLQQDQHNLGALMKVRHLERLQEDPEFVALMEAHDAALEPVFRMAESIRINLAKHEIKGKPNAPVRAPGYGRINGMCGALDFELDMGDNTYQLINRRDIAEALRRVGVAPSHQR